MSAARILLLAVAAGGCAHSGSGGAPEACEPTPAGGATSNGRSLAGDYTLTLVATSGDSAGRQVSGALRLTSTARTDAALTGTTEVAVRQVGAAQPGELRVAGDSAPGVLVMDVPGSPPSVILRLGSRANERGVIRFEGEYTALTVHRMGPDGFAGSWRSGDVRERAAGHFCARRDE